MDDIRPPTASNLPEFTVSEISGAVKRRLEDSFSRVRVRGEITELKRHSSGHFYFSLKDEGAKLGALIWKSGAYRLGMAPENGVEVIATGRLSSYPERSCYQLVVERLEYAGAGALLARIEMLRKRLRAEGLFEPSRKRPLPLLPSIVGVITSERGAVIQDIRTTIARRFPRHIVLWPVPVQGEGAVARIAAAIRGFDAQTGMLRPDVLVVARGGGSLEDLMPFNEEEVIRAVAACRIPVISAVGHETDTTLIDFVADCRAPTPTAAAELAVPARTELLGMVQQNASRLVSGLTAHTQQNRLRLGSAERGMPDLPMLIGTARQRLDDRSDRFSLSMRTSFAKRRGELEQAVRAIPSLRVIVDVSKQRLENGFRRLLFATPNLLGLKQSEMEQRGRLPPPTQAIAAKGAALRLAAAALGGSTRHAMSGIRRHAGEQMARLSETAIRGAIRDCAARLGSGIARLEALSPEAVLRRGYALIYDVADHPITRARVLRSGMAIRLCLADGDARATIDGRSPTAQGDLPF
ncbi:MAG: exodeoxyribonuclease VII large subunit [Acetobacteraceae bacterium]|nr:exodeoxyribonuclease VII large subunit [Acetobacteraceae bacterium]